MKFAFKTELTTTQREAHRLTRIRLGNVTILFKDQSPVLVSCGEEYYEVDNWSGAKGNQQVSYQLLLFHLNRLLGLQGTELATREIMKEMEVED